MSDELGEKRSHIRVHIAQPTYGSTPAICQLAFGSFIGHGVAQGFISHLGEVEGAYIDRARNDLVRQAINNDATHVLFIDQDMIIPEGTLSRLLAHDVDIVGGTYFGKDDWFTPVAFHLDPFRRVYEFEDLPEAKSGRQVQIKDEPWPELALPEGIGACPCGAEYEHIHEVGGTGMGCTLIKVGLLRRIQKHFGDDLWFSSKETGEDVHLAQRCADIGVTRYIDGFIQCGHVRNQIVTKQHYDWAKQNAPRCKIEGCTRSAFWDVKNADAAESAERCWFHREVKVVG